KLKTSTLTIEITKNRNPAQSNFSYSLVKKLVPAGLWGETTAPALTGKKFLENVATGIEITPSAPPDAGKTKEIEVDNFKYADANYRDDFNWQQGSKFNLEKTDDAAARRKKIADTISSNKQRDALMHELGMTFAITMGKTVADDFVTAPQ